MERKLSGSKSPGTVSATAEPPDTDSARSTPDAGTEARGAIPKSRSTGKLNALRSSLREVGKSSSFKIKRNKEEKNETDEKKSGKKEKKKLKKGKKEQIDNSPSQIEKVAGVDEGTLVTSPLQPSTSSESLLSKASKVSKAPSLFCKLSIGRYRDRGKNPHESPSNKALSPTSTSPELSPTASRTDVSEDDAPSVTSSASEGRQGPEGDDGARPPSAAERRSMPFELTSPPLTPPTAWQPPPPTAGLGQSRLIGSGVYKGPSDQSETPSSRSAATVVVTTSTIASAVVRQPLESATPRKDRDPALETVHEDQADNDEASSQPSPLETERSPPATPAFHSAFTSLDEAAPLQESTAPGSSRAATAVYMSQRLGTSAAADAASTKSQILSITTPALKKQQALEEVRAASAAVAAPDLKPVTVSTEPPSSRASDYLEDDQFGDVDDDTATVIATSSHAPAMSAPPPSAATAMAEARARLSQSLGGSTDLAAQPVNEKREHLYKILVIGELGTGKTSIIKRYVHQFFSQHYRATIGVDFALKVLNWDANTVIRLQLWDIAGQERFGNMTRVYYKEAVGAFIVFDVTRAATFDAVIKWKQDLDAKVQLADGSPIPCVLLANKCDQQKEGIVNNVARMDEYCRERGFSAWFETSAKENINIEDAARCLVTKILQNDKLIHNDNGKDNDKFALDSKAQKDEKSGKSCAC